jgi:hypothetical protein
VTKKLGGARVSATDNALGIRDKDGVGRNIEQVLQRGSSELGPILLRDFRCGLIRGIRWLHYGYDLNGKYPFCPELCNQNSGSGRIRG